MKILVAHPHFTYPGGASAVALKTAVRFARAGHEVHMASIRADATLAEAARGVEFHDLGGSLSGSVKYWLSVRRTHRRFYRFADALGPDVVLAHTFPANYWAFGYKRRRPHVGCVWYCHEPSAYVHERRVIVAVPWPMRAAVLAANPALQAADRILVKSADAIVANSPFTAGRVREIYGIGASVIEPGVDVGSEHCRGGQKENLVLAVAQLTRFKRMDLLVRAAASLKAEGLNVRFVVAGWGNAGPELCRLAQRLGVNDMVSFVGRIEARELTDYYRRALVVAVPAEREPFGLVVAEGMAFGAAIVCSDTGGPAEICPDGTAGLHFRAGDAPDLARKIGFLLRHRETAKAMGRTGERMARRYNWDEAAVRLEEIVQSAASKAEACRPHRRSGQPETAHGRAPTHR